MPTEDEFRQWTEAHAETHAKDREDMSQKFTRVSEQLIEHKTRLENGTQSFNQLRSDLAELKPKRTPRWQLLLMIFGPAVTIISLVWAIGKMFDDRPTASQIEKIMTAHVASEHPATVKRLETLQEEQVKQRIVQEKLVTTLDAIGRDLNDLKLDIKSITAAKAARR